MSRLAVVLAPPEPQLQHAALAPHYQLEITRPRNLDELTVLVERATGAGSADGDAAGGRAVPELNAVDIMSGS